MVKMSSFWPLCFIKAISVSHSIYTFRWAYLNVHKLRRWVSVSASPAEFGGWPKSPSNFSLESQRHPIPHCSTTPAFCNRCGAVWCNNSTKLCQEINRLRLRGHFHFTTPTRSFSDSESGWNGLELIAQSTFHKTRLFEHLTRGSIKKDRCCPTVQKQPRNICIIITTRKVGQVRLISAPIATFKEDFIQRVSVAVNRVQCQLSTDWARVWHQYDSGLLRRNRVNARPSGVKHKKDSSLLGSVTHRRRSSR